MRHCEKLRNRLHCRALDRTPDIASCFPTVCSTSCGSYITPSTRNAFWPLAEAKREGGGGIWRQGLPPRLIHLRSPSFPPTTHAPARRYADGPSFGSPWPRSRSGCPRAASRAARGAGRSEGGPLRPAPGAPPPPGAFCFCSRTLSFADASPIAQPRRAIAGDYSAAPPRGIPPPLQPKAARARAKRGQRRRGAGEEAAPRRRNGRSAAPRRGPSKSPPRKRREAA
eukprot:gene1452-biopygen1383